LGPRAIASATIALALLAPTATVATTAHDLSARIVVDGRIGEYEDDEWVLDEFSSPAESPGDSRWGSDNEVRRVAVTWDDARLYLAVDCVTLDSELILWLDAAAGGIRGMQSLPNFRRNVVFSGFAPDLLLVARPESEEPTAIRLRSDGAPELLETDVLDARFVQFATEGGALEVAIPWALLEPAGGVIGLLAAISGGTGAGCGDAAPDPSAPLETPQNAIAYLDRALHMTFDGDADGSPDVGVSPRDLAVVEAAGPVVAAHDVSIGVRVDVRSFAPDRGESVSFTLRRDSEEAVSTVYVSSRVYSLSGELVRVLFEDEPRAFDVAEGPPLPEDSWDGRDGGGNVVPGGVYVINVSWGLARGARSGAANVSVAVVR